jgi:hypothetical protein
MSASNHARPAGRDVTWFTQDITRSPQDVTWFRRDVTWFTSQDITWI